MAPTATKKWCKGHLEGLFPSVFATAEAAPTQVPIDFTTTSSNDTTTKLLLELITSLRKQDYIVIPDASPEKQDDAT